MSETSTRDCLDPWLNGFIQYNGDVNPCCFVRTVWGNIHRNTAEEIFNSEPARALRRELLEGNLQGSCVFCPHRPMTSVVALRRSVERIFEYELVEAPSAAVTIADRFEALAPWRTRFAIDGEAYGGELDYSGDRRIATFFEWFGTPRTILELSSFEGGHTLQLAAPETTERVLGVEGRTENVDRARLVADLLGRGNTEFVVGDLETVDLAAYGRFDAVFCAGLLYHLVTPWRLLAEIARVSDRLFLDTHYWTKPEVVEVDRHAGGWYKEGGYDDPLSGLSGRSFWLTKPSLVEALADAGWSVRNEVDHPDWGGGAGARVWLGCVRPGAQSSSDRSVASTG